MKIKVFVLSIVLIFCLAIKPSAGNSILTGKGVINVKYSWEQEYLDEGYSTIKGTVLLIDFERRFQSGGRFS